MLAVNVVVMFVGAWRIGISWDEPIHVVRLQSWFDTGWYLPPSRCPAAPLGPAWRAVRVRPGNGARRARGGRRAGAEGIGESGVAAEAYAARHVAVALFAVLGLLAVAATAGCSCARGAGG